MRRGYWEIRLRRKWVVLCESIGNASFECSEKVQHDYLEPQSPRYTGIPYTTGAAPFRYRK